MSSLTETESSSPVPTAIKKRKRELDTQEIEVDINAPEPPSKKALRKAKKGKNGLSGLASEPAIGDATSTGKSQPSTVPEPENRSEHGIWIGNLPWTATKQDLRNFITQHTEISEGEITRVHMPSPAQATLDASKQRLKPQNKGFAYVDFSTEAALDQAIALSESLLSGRRVLIKNAKSFDGRPDPVKQAEEELQKASPPSKKVFVGNLAFDIDEAILRDHFEKCGEVADVFIATFEDTGKCKGYGWVTFEEKEAAAKAVRGWVEMDSSKLDGDEEEDELPDSNSKKPNKAAKPRKWWVNRIRGREVRMEFAEDDSLRYKKRFSKKGTKNNEDLDLGGKGPTGSSTEVVSNEASLKRPDPRQQRSSRSEGLVDTRKAKPGAALPGAPRLTGAIVESTGTKKTFK